MTNNYYCRSIADDDDDDDDGFDGRTRGRNEQHPPGCKCYSRAPNLSSVYEQSLEELKFQKSACHFAQIGNATKLRQLLEKDSERWTNSVDGPLSGLTPLHYASRNGHLECVRLLLEKKYGCEVNARTKSGSATALMRASARGEFEIVEALLKAGADASLRDDDGETALHKVHDFSWQETKRRREAVLEEEKEEIERRKRVDVKIDKIVKALVAAYPEAVTVKNRKGEKPGERES